VIQQFYQTRVNDEFVLIGNSATLKCLIPSFVADFVSIAEWLDDEGTSYTSQGIGTCYLLMITINVFLEIPSAVSVFSHPLILL
jgi:hypothetical protein